MMTTGSWLEDRIGWRACCSASWSWLILRRASGARTPDPEALMLLQQQLDGLRSQLTQSLSGQGALLGSRSRSSRAS
jgi:hypothetical protein